MIRIVEGIYLIFLLLDCTLCCVVKPGIYYRW